jgi:hypothetical protein
MMNLVSGAHPFVEAQAARLAGDIVCIGKEPKMFALYLSQPPGGK